MKYDRGYRLARHFKYSIQKVETKLGAGIDASDRMQQVTYILSRYRAANYPFSIELCGAILRQGSFIDKMVDLGWTKASTFDNNSTPLVRCVSRYHAWLNIMSQFPSRMLVPTLVCDLAWHTHQLKHEAYRSQTLDIIGRFVDHDDKVEENTLSDAYDQTAKFWEQSYGVPYHVCGCIHPPNKTVTAPEPRISPPRQRPDSFVLKSIKIPHMPIRFFPTMLSRALKGGNKVSPRPIDDPTPTTTTVLTSAPVFTNTHPQMMSIKDSNASATHPSEHNSVVVTGRPSTQSRRDSRLRTRTLWDKQTRAAVDNGKVPSGGWEAQSIRRAEGHNQAFMRPLPDPNLAPVVPFGAETCVAHNGGVLDGLTLPERCTDGRFSAGVCAAGIRTSDTNILGEMEKHFEPVVAKVHPAPRQYNHYTPSTSHYRSAHPAPRQYTHYTPSTSHYRSGGGFSFSCGGGGFVS
ncbi:ATP-dependent RNA helicase DOB1 [Ceratobasidium sp. AG-Ba]|nr:ATP-dependent RNA helicase DOB1 [Ceratobasidium sp. AG-Ba]